MDISGGFRLVAFFDHSSIRKCGLVECGIWKSLRLPKGIFNTIQSINKLESVQRRAARFVMNDYYQTIASSVTNMLSRLNWNTIEVHFKHLRLQTLHKIIHSSVDVSLPNYITYRKR